MRPPCSARYLGGLFALVAQRLSERLGTLSPVCFVSGLGSFCESCGDYLDRLSLTDIVYIGCAVNLAFFSFAPAFDN